MHSQRWFSSLGITSPSSGPTDIVAMFPFKKQQRIASDKGHSATAVFRVLGSDSDEGLPMDAL